MVGIGSRGFGVLVAFLALLGVAPRAFAAGDRASPPEKTLSPYFFVENGDPGVDRLPLERTRVDIAVAGSIADVTVTQRYRNDGKRPIHARYVFPASTRAAVHGMKMVIGKQTIVAKIKEKQAAETEFQAAKKAGKNAALLEEERPNVFTMNVANVVPGETIDVTLQYTELLVPTEGTYEVVYPTVVGPRYSNESATTAKDKWIESPYLREGEEPKSVLEISGTLSSGIPIARVASPSHRITQSFDNPGFGRFSLADADKYGGNRDFILRYGLAGASIQSGLSLFESPASGEKFFQLVVEPPERVKPADLPPREYVFILDVSGSMEGFPLDTAKRLLNELTAELRPVDRFNVLLFSGTSFLLEPASIEATPANVQRALSVIGKERGGGGTELLPALGQALSLPHDPTISRTFVVMTDGYIQADREAVSLVRGHLSDANVFSFGIGSSVNRFLIEGLAKAGLGEPFVVTDAGAAADAANRFHSYIAAPVLTNIHVAFDGFDVEGVEPPTFADVFAERPLVVQGRYRGKPLGTVSVTGRSGAGVYTQRFDVAATPPRPENRALEYLWARSKIAALGDFGFEAPGDAARKEITALGLHYNLLTPFTSFIAISEVVKNPGAPATDVDQPLALPAGVSATAVGESVEGAPEPEIVVFGMLSALLGAALFAARARARTVLA